jgi:reactive intermediate/imine deaminase
VRIPSEERAVAKIVVTKDAPAPIGPYSQAVRAGDTVYVSGVIGLDPATGELVAGGVAAQAERVFASLAAIASAAGGSLANAVKLTIYLTDLADFAAVNEQMTRAFHAPFPARATVGVKELPRSAAVEIDAVLVLA